PALTPHSTQTRLFLNNAFVSPSLSKSFTLTNPATELPIAEVSIATKEDVDLAVRYAKAAQPAWEELGPAGRSGCLYKLAGLMEEEGHAMRLKEASWLDSLDAMSMGRPVRVQGLDIAGSAAKLRFDANLAQSVMGESSLHSPGALGVVLRQAFGVTAAALYLAGLTVKAGFPPGIIQVISGLGETGKLLAEHMEIRKISFTGSTRTGRLSKLIFPAFDLTRAGSSFVGLVAAAAAMSNLKEVALELGGKNPTSKLYRIALLVFSGTVDKFASSVSTFALPPLFKRAQLNSSSFCEQSSSRLYVHEKIATEFMAKFKAIFGAFKHGDPLDPTTTLGPQADEIQGKSVLSFIDIGKADGKLEMGGVRVGSKGYFVEPTIFSGVPEDSRISKEEIFGPVVIIHTFTDEDEVIRRANDTEYGLYAAVFTKNIDRAIRVAKKLEAGMVGVNATSPLMAPDQPFGGMKQSGQSREGGINSVMRWTEEKSVFIKFA
ncbi:hypothetical protein P7C70_g6295, partial [Phenoliferia sp. Uapishka_3]